MKKAFKYLPFLLLPATYAQTFEQPANHLPSLRAILDPSPATPKFEIDIEARAIFGFQQSGAANANAARNYFFDFYIKRPLTSRLSLWGNVRISSAPDQQNPNTTIAELLTQFTTKAAKIPINRLAQRGEFLTGFDLQLARLNHRRLSAVIFWGASGSFESPASAGRIFEAPAPDTPQWPAFTARYPDFTDPSFRQNVRYIGLITRAPERFYHQYGAGFRLTSYSATYTITAGQDQQITAGSSKGVVARIDVFYPLHRFLYLFATANLRIAKPHISVPLALHEVTNDGPQLYHSNVAIYYAPSSHDTYSIGAGLNLLNILRAPWRRHSCPP